MSAPLVTSPVVQAVTDAISDAMTGDLADVATLGASDPMQGYQLRSVTVGSTWDPEIGAVATDQTIVTTVAESGAARRLTETTLVQCVAYAGSGDDDLPGHRASVGAILGAVRSAVRAVMSVDGAASRAQVSDEQWAQGSDEQGSFVLVSFTVSVVRLL